ncbi:c-type cytochrome biogenesis protein CcsB [Microbacterium excoecariae]|uniref:c-type cytochrome biogenesis protein CcsB n=1 Tax=Microbacterium excoecariae TaxID=2715210 RepID=UPI001408CB39|nr:c-type cytochrome biogenesis protein CcsB [Microbacterium excoecariae]NHI17944.1 c-type cytochrome biogenesis protein CcsB [Microbacterium excoecariae]
MLPDHAVALDTWSVISLWTAIAVYALAFIAYAVDLARRSEASVRMKDRRAELVAAGGGSALAEEPAGGDPAVPHNPVMARIGTTLTWIAFLLHLAAAVMRGIGAGRVPWSNMYEFAMMGTLLVTGVYLGVLFWKDLRYLGAFMTGLVTVLLGASSMFYVEITPLMDPLKSVWLVIHVFVASLATAFLALGFALSVLQLLQARRERRAVEDESLATKKSLLRTLPSAEALEGLAYRFAIVGFIFWTFTLIAGSIWAQDAWGRYWGFDTKEVWTFIIWVLYAGYIHARATRGWQGTRSAWLSIVGFVAVLFNFTIVNMFFEGLHAYSGLE